MPTFDRSGAGLGAVSGVTRGAYVLAEAEGGPPEVLLLATGSEVQLAMAAREELQAAGVRARVVSMPCWELFDRQPQAYRDEVLPPSVRARVSIEQASTLGWDRYIGDVGASVGMHTFGASAPLETVARPVRLHAGRRCRGGPGAGGSESGRPRRRLIVLLGGR